MMRKTLTQLIGAGALLIVLLAAYGAWFYTVSEQSAKMNVLATQVETSAADTARVAAAKAALQQLSANEQAVYSHFVSTSDVVPFLESLQNVGTSLGANITVASVSAVPGPSGSARGQLQLSLTITGSFDSVMRTLGALEYSKYDMQITSLSLGTNDAQGKGARSWTANVSFIVATTNETPVAPAPGPSAASSTPASAASPAVSASVSTPSPITTPAPTATHATSAPAPTSTAPSTSAHTGTLTPLP